MANNSATGGYLQPTTPSPAYDLALDVQVQNFVVGITGLDGKLVRPRWQPRPPAQPERDVNWCAVGIMSIDTEYGHSTQHRPTGDGYDEAEAYETLELLASFYGPGCSGLAALLRDGLWVAQNREAMRAQGMALLEVRRVTRLGEDIGGEWRQRADLPIRLSRNVSRSYPVLNLLQAQLALETGDYTQTANTPPEI